MDSPAYAHELLDRRAFLRAAGGVLAGAALASCSDGVGPTSATPGALAGQGRPKRVVVIGAGISGLVAGFELDRAGHDVTVVEARERVGGRVLTLRAPFTGGRFAEAGAARIPPEHDLTLGYAAHFGLALTPFYPRAGRFLAVAAGARTPVEPGSFLASRPDFVKLAAGSESLPHAFAAALGARVRTGLPVAGVEEGSGSVVVRLDDGALLEADRALCTSPLPVLGRIRFDPPLPALVAEAAAGGFRYQPALRVFVRFDARFWEADGLNGWAVTDWPEELWHPTWDQPGPGGILLSYVRGDRARVLDALPPAARLAAVVEHWESVFPGAAAAARDGTDHSWQADPWSGAAWAAPTTAQDARYLAALTAPHGRVHFAGEHLSGDRGWMQGALASGIRAAQEIHAAP